MRSASWPHAPGNVGGRRGLSWVERGVREARIPGPVCAHACAALGKLASACGVCGLDFVRKKKNHEGVWRYLGWTFSFFFFFSFPAWLQTSRGSESPRADDLISTVSQQCAEPSAGGLPSQAFGAEGMEGA